MDLNTIWFVLISVLFVGYAILDGFDLGVGVLHLFSRSDHERRVHLNAIGPVWDGNEVWLVTGGGALFAAFPVVYATVFSGFYIALMLLLAALIFRAVSIEFRSKVESTRWKTLWDWMFGIGSTIAAVLFGVAFGNILRGVPIDSAHMWTGSFLGLLNPYAILIGLLTLCLFTMHGAIYMSLKSEADLRDRVAAWIPGSWMATMGLYALATVATIVVSPFLFAGIFKNPFFWVLFVLLLAAALSIPFSAKAKKYGWAFIGSSVSIGCMFGLSAISLFPRLVPSITDLNNSLTIYNASSSETTLSTMLVIALIGMPLVIIYTVVIYRVFKGKVVITEESY